MSSEKTTRDILLDRLCTQIYRIQIIFLIALFFFLFSLIATFRLEPGTPVYVVNVINLVGLFVFVVVFGTLTWLCNSREVT